MIRDFLFDSHTNSIECSHRGVFFIFLKKSFVCKFDKFTSI